MAEIAVLHDKNRPACLSTSPELAFFGANTLYISVCMQSNANPGSSCPIELLVCVSAGWFGRLMSDQMSGHLACTQTATLRHVAVNDCFISLRQRWVVTTWGSYCVRVCVCVQTIGKGGLNSCGQKMERGRYQI